MKRINYKKEYEYARRNIIGLGIITIFLLVGFILGFILAYDRSEKLFYCQEEKESYSSRLGWYIEFYNEHKTRCDSPNDCYKKPELKGCHRTIDDCNQCCFDSCTLLACANGVVWKINE